MIKYIKSFKFLIEKIDDFGLQKFQMQNVKTKI